MTPRSESESGLDPAWLVRDSWLDDAPVSLVAIGSPNDSDPLRAYKHLTRPLRHSEDI